MAMPARGAQTGASGEASTSAQVCQCQPPARRGCFTTRVVDRKAQMPSGSGPACLSICFFLPLASP